MWKIASISLPPVCELNPDLHRELLSILPEGDIRGTYFGFAHKRLDDTRVQGVIATLARHGYSPSPAQNLPRERQYALSISRRYRPHELAKFAYLKLRAQKYDFDNGIMTDDGVITLHPKAIKKGADSVVLSNEEVLVPDRVKHLIEASDLRHVLFRPTLVREGPRWWDKNTPAVPWDRFDEPWWEITSDFILPRLSPSATLVDKEGNPYIEGVSKGCLLREDHFVEPQLIYRHHELDVLDSFDIAKTYEYFGIGRTHEGMRCKVVSSRFFSFWRAHGLKATWLPVRLEG